MPQEVKIKSNKELQFSEFCEFVGINTLILSMTPEDVPGVWEFYRKGFSTTIFAIEYLEDEYILSMDELASWDDYRLFPYLVDSLHLYLTGKAYKVDGKNAFRQYDEQWAAYCMGEQIAYLKCVLKLGLKYYIDLPITGDYVYVTEELLNAYGVTLNSSTPRIYGYVQYLLMKNLLPRDNEMDLQETEEEEVDVPQHVSIGRVKSWQTDGAETWESYSKEDAELLLTLAEAYRNGRKVEGVVLNDIGTIHEHGIGTTKDVQAAVRWYEEAFRQGDHLYAPTNLGDIYRKGAEGVPQDRELSVRWYMLTEDPYAWYRIGQSFEEGWNGAPDMNSAMLWYKRAAEAKHHLALKRLETN